MNKKFIIGIVAVIVIALIFLSIIMFNYTSLNGNAVKINNNKNRPVKEFTMTAFYNESGIWYSLNEITVNKGDLVRIKTTNIKGMHDFKIDEMGVFSELPLNQEVVVEFIAENAGEFIYYCTKPNHRQKGQWGTLKVIE